jgi:hypothetical protein
MDDGRHSILSGHVDLRTKFERPVWQYNVIPTRPSFRKFMRNLISTLPNLNRHRRHLRETGVIWLDSSSTSQGPSHAGSSKTPMRQKQLHDCCKPLHPKAQKSRQPGWVDMRRGTHEVTRPTRGSKVLRAPFSPFNICKSMHLLQNTSSQYNLPVLVARQAVFIIRSVQFSEAACLQQDPNKLGKGT